MNFYTSIARFYDYIFPVSSAQVNFVSDSLSNIKSAKLLDVGCGTGNLTLSLSEKCRSIVGIDIDDEMLNLAKQKPKPENVSFEYGNMLTLNEKFLANEFEGVICFGNTLVHLDNLAEVESCIQQYNSILKTGGKLLIQIINYDRILNEEISFLPTIENEFIKFERDYCYLKVENKIKFKTRLTSKTSSERIDNEHMLYPITEIELYKVFINNGFEVLNRYGSFNKEKLTINSVQLIMEALKK
jgi:ubiquinone/menaquinone biosynthesis C-methylase UbiE